jgi:two-component system chemotaxis response regulator CheB
VFARRAHIGPETMAHRDIIVIGASLGGVEAIPSLLETFPADLPAAVFVVLHMHDSGPSRLLEIARRASSFPVKNAVDGERIEPGQGYLGVPSRHLMLQSGRVRLADGPRDCHARPSINVLFRSAAHEFGRRVIGVVMTGMLDDGSAGLWAIKDRGGIAIVQSPDEAPYPQMPANAARQVAVDHTLKVAEMADVLARLVGEELSGEETPMENKGMKTELDIAGGARISEAEFSSLGEPSLLTCPECQGSMVRITEGRNERYRCHTGHAFGEASLSQQQLQSIEAAITHSLALLEEREFLYRTTAQRRKDAGNEPEYERQLTHADRMRDMGAVLKKLLESPDLVRPPESGESGSG